LGVFTNMTEQTFSGVYSTASKDTQWLSLDRYAALVCGNAFKSSDLVNGKKDVFLNIPGAILRSYPGIGRVIIGALINAMTQADGAFKRRALFMLDEVDLLGYMRVLEEARDRGRKYGITMMLMYQSVGQLERHFGKDGATSWIDGCAFASYAAIKALETARNVSAQCGEMTVEVEGKLPQYRVEYIPTAGRGARRMPQPATSPSDHAARNHPADAQGRADHHRTGARVRSAAGGRSTSGERTWMRRPVRTVSSSPPFSGRAVPVERIFRAGRREPVEEQIVADRKDEHAERGGKEKPPRHGRSIRIDEDTDRYEQHDDAGDEQKAGEGAERAGDEIEQMPGGVETGAANGLEHVEGQCDEEGHRAQRWPRVGRGSVGGVVIAVCGRSHPLSFRGERHCS
jgi:hypothetical protein